MDTEKRPSTEPADADASPLVTPATSNGASSAELKNSEGAERTFVPQPDAPPTDEKSRRQRRRAFALIFVSLMCVGMGQSLLFSVLPPIARELGLTEIQTGSIFTVSALVWVFMSPFWGRQSDRFGRKPIFVLGLATYAVSMVLFAYTIHLGMVAALPLFVAYILIVASRSLYGFLGSGTVPSAQAYVADRTTREERASGVAMTGNAFGLGTTIGPAAASALVVFGLLAPLYAVSVLAAASAVAVWFLLPERRPPGAFDTSRPPPKRLRITDRRILPILIIGVAVGTTQAVNFQTMAFYMMDKLALTPDETVQSAGVVFMATAMAALFAQFVLIERFNLSTRFLVRAGLVIVLAANLLIAFAVTFGILVFAYLLIGLGMGMVRPGLVAAASLAVSKEEQGAVAGLTGSMFAAGHIVGPLVGTSLYRYWFHESPFLLNAALIVLCLLFIIVRNIARSREARVPDQGDSGVPKG